MKTDLMRLMGLNIIVVVLMLRCEHSPRYEAVRFHLTGGGEEGVDVWEMEQDLVKGALEASSR